MSDNSKIEWLSGPNGAPGATWNPVVGCTRVSEGCRNCYAERVAKRMVAAGVRGYEGVLDAHGRWSGRVNLVRSALDAPLRWRRPRRVFVNSMSDLFHPEVPDDAIAAVFRVIYQACKHQFLILTKRPSRMVEWFSACGDHETLGWTTHNGSPPSAYGGNGIIVGNENEWPLRNVWLGVSVEDQATADERIPLLMRTPAAVRFVSYEPALGPVDFGKWLVKTRTIHLGMSVRGAIRNRTFGCFTDEKTGRRLSKREAEAEMLELLSKGVEMLPMGKCPIFDPKTGCPGHPDPRIDWVICGGESGPDARPMHPDWASSVRDQCQAAGVPFFFKQWGEWISLEDWAARGCEPDGPTWVVMPPERMTIVPSLSGGKDDADMYVAQMVRVGKRAAGALLDGREWREWPEASA